jgi:hypothetical protein
MALAAFVAFAVAPSVASAANSPVITHPTGTVLNPTGKTCGTTSNAICIKGTNLGETIMRSAAEGGTVLTRCTTSVMTGALTKNENNTVEGNVTSATFSGSGSAVNGVNECTGTFGNITVTTAVANGLPWCMRSTATMAEDEFQIRGGLCSVASREIRFILDSTTAGECTYGRTAAIIGRYTTDTPVNENSDAIVHITGQKFERKAGGFLCPTEGYLEMSFTLETDTEKAEPLYFS